MTFLRRLASVAVAFYRREPARCNSLIATAVVALAVRLGLRLDGDNVLQFVGIVVPFIVASVVTRSQVTPVRKPLARGGVVHVKPLIAGEDYHVQRLADAVIERIEFQGSKADWSPAHPDVKKPKGDA